MGSLTVDVTPILEVTGGSVDVETGYDIPSLVVGDETFTARGPVSVAATVTNTGAGFVASGSVTFPATAQCARCLKDFELDLSGEVEGFYVRHGHDRDLPDDQEFGYVEDGAVDLGAAIESALALEAPFAPLHSADCKGLCPECGADLNEGPCACPRDEDADGPFAALQGYDTGEAEADAGDE
ncbi:MAG: DUF177 domain-containing protein [Actinobacteria bacterium]|nr:MAG: DUF177 domain-containing protein [Actinomycetota bacterium]